MCTGVNRQSAAVTDCDACAYNKKTAGITIAVYAFVVHDDKAMSQIPSDLICRYWTAKDKTAISLFEVPVLSPSPIFRYFDAEEKRKWRYVSKELFCPARQAGNHEDRLPAHDAAEPWEGGNRRAYI